jgi:archaemetzincin
MIRGSLIIGVLPVGSVPDLILEIIASNIDAHLNLPSKILPFFLPPAEALDKRRQQYDAAKMLQAFSVLNLKRFQKVVAVCTEDLFVPILTHVHGEAQQGGKFAVVSLFRLHHDPILGGLTSLFYERAVKVTLHEIGHLFSLLHCADKRCLMHFSSTLDQLDATPIYFCRYCFQYFNAATKRR